MFLRQISRKAYSGKYWSYFICRCTLWKHRYSIHPTFVSARICFDSVLAVSYNFHKTGFSIFALILRTFSYSAVTKQLLLGTVGRHHLWKIASSFISFYLQYIWQNVKCAWVGCELIVFSAAANRMVLATGARHLALTCCSEVSVSISWWWCTVIVEICY